MKSNFRNNPELGPDFLSQFKSDFIRVILYCMKNFSLIC